MKTFLTTTQSALDSGVTTFCRCWKVTLSDTGPTVLGFTDHDKLLSFDGVDFEPRSGFTRSETVQRLGLAVDTADIAGSLSSDRITEDDLTRGIWDDATVDTYLVDWSDVTVRDLIDSSSIGEVERGDLSFRAEMRGLAHELNQEQGRLYQRISDTKLGDARCGIDLNNPLYKGTLAVAAVLDNRVLTVSGINGFDDDWFTRGPLTWTTGNNVGVVQPVRLHAFDGTTASVVLWQAAPLVVQIGDAATIQAGCDKTFETCKTKFNNGDNHRGHPHMPGNDIAFKYVVGEDGDHDGGSFFN